MRLSILRDVPRGYAATIRGQAEGQLADYLTPDLCVIGAGAGGLAVAEWARAYGASVVLVESGRLGGSMFNTGALPIRALGAAAAAASAVRGGAGFGIAADEGKVAFRRLHDHLDQVIAGAWPEASAERLAALGVEVILAPGRFVDKRTLAAGEQLIRARRFVVATGSRPAVPNITGLDSVPYFTTDSIVDNTRKLTHLVVIGGDALALEIAQSYRRLGTEVTVVAPAALLGAVDAELAGVALDRLREDGVTLLDRTTVTAIQARSMGIGVVIEGAGGSNMLDASHILVAAGRVPAIEGLDAEKAGLRRRADHPDYLELRADGITATNPRVFVVGDVSGSSASVPEATAVARAAVRNVVLAVPMGRPTAGTPRVVYTDPELAEVGLNEAAARTRHGIGFRVLRAAYAENDKARAHRDMRGLAKLMIDRSGRIIGAGIVGPGASELAGLFALALAMRLRVRDLAKVAAPYPSYAEIAARLGAEQERLDAARPWVRRLASLVRLLG